MIETAKENEKGVLVAVADKKASTERMEEMMNELEFLSQTLKIDVQKKFFQRLDRPDTRFFVGKGKLEEIITFCKAEKTGGDHF